MISSSSLLAMAMGRQRSWRRCRGEMPCDLSTP